MVEERLKHLSQENEKELHELNVLFRRWSFTIFSIPVLWYLFLLLVILVLTLPLRYNLKLEDKYSKCQHPFATNNNLISDEDLEIHNDYLALALIGKDQSAYLRNVFTKADLNYDGKLDIIELTYYIRMNIIHHIDAAVRNNPIIFSEMDVDPKNGLVSWQEYQDYLKRKKESELKGVANNEFKKSLIERSYDERTMRDKAAWIAVAESLDNAITADDFLTFSHPESSVSNHLRMIQEIYERLDRNGDELLTEDEFSVLQAGQEQILIIKQAVDQRRREFRKELDINGDGKADKTELLNFYAPSSPRHSEAEAGALLSIADNNHDRLLSFDEMLAHSTLFLNSKMVDMTSFHNEF